MTKNKENGRVVTTMKRAAMVMRWAQMPGPSSQATGSTSLPPAPFMVVLVKSVELVELVELVESVESMELVEWLRSQTPADDRDLGSHTLLSGSTSPNFEEEFFYET